MRRWRGCRRRLHDQRALLDLDNPDASILQQRCHCDPGYTACGSVCVATKTDSSNCGYCGKSCGGGSCVNGLCGGSLPDAGWSVHAGTVDEASAAGSGVASWAHEGTQEMSLKTGILFGKVNYGDQNDAGPGGAKWNSTDAGNTTWGTDLRQLPLDAGGLDGFDTSATTSGWSGREYLASILIDTVAEAADAGQPHHCIGVTSANAATFPDWGTNALTCINAEGTGWDKPSISFDTAGTTLWASGQETAGPGAGQLLLQERLLARAPLATMAEVDAPSRSPRWSRPKPEQVIASSRIDASRVRST